VKAGLMENHRISGSEIDEIITDSLPGLRIVCTILIILIMPFCTTPFCPYHFLRYHCVLGPSSRKACVKPHSKNGCLRTVTNLRFVLNSFVFTCLIPLFVIVM